MDRSFSPRTTSPRSLDHAARARLELRYEASHQSLRSDAPIDPRLTTGHLRLSPVRNSPLSNPSFTSSPSRQPSRQDSRQTASRENSYVKPPMARPGRSLSPPAKKISPRWVPQPKKRPTSRPSSARSQHSRQQSRSLSPRSMPNSALPPTIFKRGRDLVPPPLRSLSGSREPSRVFSEDSLDGSRRSNVMIRVTPAGKVLSPDPWVTFQELPRKEPSPMPSPSYHGPAGSTDWHTIDEHTHLPIRQYSNVDDHDLTSAPYDLHYARRVDAEESVQSKWARSSPRSAGSRSQSPKSANLSPGLYSRDVRSPMKIMSPMAMANRYHSARNVTCGDRLDFRPASLMDDPRHKAILRTSEKAVCDLQSQLPVGEDWWAHLEPDEIHFPLGAARKYGAPTDWHRQKVESVIRGRELRLMREIFDGWLVNQIYTIDGYKNRKKVGVRLLAMSLRKLVRRIVRSTFHIMWVELFAVVTRSKRQIPVSIISDLVNKRYFALNDYTARRCFQAWVQSVNMKKRLYRQLTHFSELSESSWKKMIFKAWRRCCSHLRQRVPANAHRQLQRSVIRKWFSNWRKSSDITHAFDSYCDRSDAVVSRQYFIRWRNHYRRSKRFKKGLNTLFRVLTLPGPRKAFGTLSLRTSVRSSLFML